MGYELQVKIPHIRKHAYLKLGYYTIFQFRQYLLHDY